MNLSSREVARPLRIAQVVPVAQSVPPTGSGSIETVADLLVRGLVARGHDVTLFATGTSSTPATLDATFDRGYHDDPALWPWEVCELFNIAAAMERADRFDLLHVHAEYAPLSLAFHRLTATPVIHTVHHAPTPAEVALWRRYPEAPFIAISAAQAARLDGLRVLGSVHHAVDVDRFRFEPDPDDYLLFLGRFTEGKGARDAITVARRTNHRLVLAAAENAFYREHIAPLVDGRQVVFRGEVTGAAKRTVLGKARALLYPVRADEPFGLVLPEAMACGTPVAALDRGAVREVVDHGVSGVVCDTLDALVAAVPRVLALDRRRVHDRAATRFHPDRMVDGYVHLYTELLAGHHGPGSTGMPT